MNLVTELTALRAQVAALENELKQIAAVIPEDLLYGRLDIAERIARFAKTEAMKLTVDKMREAFDAGSGAMLDRIEEILIGKQRVITKETIEWLRIAIIDRDTQLEGRP